jgi:hypothetical protein
MGRARIAKRKQALDRQKPSAAAGERAGAGQRPGAAQGAHASYAGVALSKEPIWH